MAGSEAGVGGHAADRNKERAAPVVLEELIVQVREGIAELPGVGDYVANSGDALTPSGFLEGQVEFRNPHATHEFSWGVADVVTAILRAGLVLEVLREYPYANGCKVYHNLTLQPGRRYAPPPGAPTMPLMLGWSARKPDAIG